LGNFRADFAKAFLAQMAELVGEGGALLIGLDLQKDTETLEAAYNDKAGVTAAFNTNLLRRMNRELDADFDLDAFEHQAFYNEDDGRIESHIVSLRDQTVRVAGRAFSFAKGETIYTECSHKYTLQGFARIASAAGFRVERVWTDEDRLFSVQYAVCVRS
ncbi:MAG: L-histidine N(alpha)-methyltransferase, partial [Phycisphaerales bacterium]